MVENLIKKSMMAQGGDPIVLFPLQALRLRESRHSQVNEAP